MDDLTKLPPKLTMSETNWTCGQLGQQLPQETFMRCGPTSCFNYSTYCYINNLLLLIFNFAT